MGRPSREAVMTALLAYLESKLQITFTATTQANSSVLTNPSTTVGLIQGLPVVGGSVPRGAIINSLSPLTLSLPAGANGAAVPFTAGFQTFGRRLVHWSQIAAQPALYLRADDDDYAWQAINSRLTIGVEIWIYSDAGKNPDAVPEVALNNLLDALDAAFAPDNLQFRRFTLGGLVEWCRPVGKAMKDPGDLDGQASARIGVEITVP